MASVVKQFEPGPQSATVRQYEANTRSTVSQLARLTVGERVAQFGFTSIQDEFLTVYDAKGQARMQMGALSDGTFGVIYAEGPPPPRPTAPIVSARQLGIVVTWDGTFADGLARPGDFARIDVHMGATADFTVDGSTIVDTIPEPGAVYIGGVGNSTRYIKIVAVSHQKLDDGTGYVASAATDAIPVLPLAVEELAARSVGAVQIAVDVLLSSRIIVGHPDNARIEIEGRDGMPPGWRAYDNLQRNTFTLDAATGDLTMLGTFRNGIPGEGIPYIEIPRGTPTAAQMLFQGTSGSNPARILAGFSPQGSIAMTSPRASANANRYGAILLDESQSTMLYDDLSTSDSLPLAQVAVNASGALVWAGPLSYVQIPPRAAAVICSPNNLLLRINQSSASAATLALQGTNASAAEISLTNTALTTAITLRSGDLAIHHPSTGALKAITASNVTNNSAYEGKTVIPMPFDIEAVVLGAPAMAWERNGEDLDAWGRRALYVGPMAGQVHPRLQRLAGLVADKDKPEALGLDSVSMTGVLWGVAGAHIERLRTHSALIAASTVTSARTAAAVDGHTTQLADHEARIKKLEAQMITVRSKLGIVL